jgi:hypothetical protein
MLQNPRYKKAKLALLAAVVWLFLKAADQMYAEVVSPIVSRALNLLT